MGRAAEGAKRQSARRVALEALLKVERQAGRADEVLQEVHRFSGLSERDRRLVTEMVYGVLRHRLRLDWALDQFCRHPVARLSPTVRNILRLGAYQLLFLDRVPARAVLHESVDLTVRKGVKGLEGLVNGVLRSLQGNREKILESAASGDLVDYLSIHYSHPSWMVRRWVARYGPDEAERICSANNQIPPVTLRVNALRAARESLQDRLRKAEVQFEVCDVSPWGLRTWGGNPAGLPEYQQGWFYIQDEASQLVAMALDPRPGEVILDVCAGPGGKTTHIAQLMGNQGRVLAVDAYPHRLRGVRENCQRLGVKIADFLLSDARCLGLKGARFDRVLADVPCSGLGVLRRNPEGKWRKTEDLITRYALLQQEILEQASAALKRGGILVYSTCTTEPEENTAVVDCFLERHPEFRVEDLRSRLPRAIRPWITPEGFLLTLLNTQAMDVFFAARLVKL